MHAPSASQHCSGVARKRRSPKAASMSVARFSYNAGPGGRDPLAYLLAITRGYVGLSRNMSAASRNQANTFHFLDCSRASGDPLAFRRRAIEKFRDGTHDDRVGGSPGDEKREARTTARVDIRTGPNRIHSELDDRTILLLHKESKVVILCFATIRNLVHRTEILVYPRDGFPRKLNGKKCVTDIEHDLTLFCGAEPLEEGLLRLFHRKCEIVSAAQHQG